MTNDIRDLGLPADRQADKLLAQAEKVGQVLYQVLGCYEGIPAEILDMALAVAEGRIYEGTDPDFFLPFAPGEYIEFFDRGFVKTAKK